MAKTRSSSAKSKGKEKDDEKLQPQSKKIKKQPKETKKAAPAKKEVAKKEKKEAPKKEKKETKKAAKGTGSSIKGYTPSQYEKYKELLKDLNGKTNNDLKEMLRKNDQSGTGTKPELIAKCADGMVLGKIPRCPKCFGGRPKFDFKSGTYKCPGFRDDEDFKFCNKKYTLEELPREDWQD